MPAGTLHFVITLSESVSTGQMFYLPTNYTRTFYTMVELHLDGQLICNSAYPGAQLHLFRLVGYYELVLNGRGLLKPGITWSPEDAQEYDILLKGSCSLYQLPFSHVD
jgi:hypothetical protein